MERPEEKAKARGMEAGSISSDCTCTELALCWKLTLAANDFGLHLSRLGACTAHHHLAPDAERRCCLDPASGATSNPEPASALMRPPPPLCTAASALCAHLLPSAPADAPAR